METKPKVTRIDRPQLPKTTRVVIYCRVSSNTYDQLNSLFRQISFYTYSTYLRYDWDLVDIYVDVESGSSTDTRTGLQRMIEDSAKDKFDWIITKSVSRFGRNTLETLEAIRKLRERRIEIYFENENLHALSDRDTFLMEIIEGFAQEENRSRRENIRWGIMQAVKSGNKKMFNRKCYGYIHDANGELVIQEEEAEVVKLIFDLYGSGYSIVGIIKELKARQIKSPTGREEWSKRTLENILENEKYIGDAILMKTYNEGFPVSKRMTNRGEKDLFKIENNNPAIISRDVFEKVAAIRAERSNITMDMDGIKRKATKYSMKKTTKEPDK